MPGRLAVVCVVVILVVAVPCGVLLRARPAPAAGSIVLFVGARVPGDFLAPGQPPACPGAPCAAAWPLVCTSDRTVAGFYLQVGAPSAAAVLGPVGQSLAANWTEFAASGLPAGIARASVWTGCAGNTCDDFTSTSGVGDVGGLCTAGLSLFSASETAACSGSLRVLCGCYAAA